MKQILIHLNNMKRFIFFCILLQSLFLQAQTGGAKKRLFQLPDGIGEKDYIANTIIIKYKTSFGQTGKVAKGLSKNRFVISPVIKSDKVISFKAKFPQVNKSGNSTLSSNEIENIYELKVDGRTPIADLINELLEDNSIEYAEPSYVCHLSYEPNDLYLQSKTNYLTQIKATEAWDIDRDAPNVIIAIVDSGSDLIHEDLKENIYINYADPINGKDDDNDGYVDNYYGWDLAGTSQSTLLEDNDPNVKSAKTEHGVHVSGLASAISNNNLGVASVASSAKLMIVKAAADDNGTTIYKGYEGVKYAADHGAQVINCSWGGQGFSEFGRDIITYAQSKGCLIVAAAGNSNSSVPEYPAAYPGVIAVANVNEKDVKGSSSNFGSYITLSAPGTSIISTLFQNRYGALTGTSMGAPIVSSAAALVKSYFPNLSMQQVGERLRVSADKTDHLNPVYFGQLGKGRLNVLRALSASSPSIRLQKVTWNSLSDEALSKGDTVEIFIDLKNFLDPAIDLKLFLSSNSSDIMVLNPQQEITVIGTMETRRLLQPFKVYIKPSIAYNSEVQFTLNCTANKGTYTDNEFFSALVAPDYVNIDVNKVRTSITSNGRIGYGAWDANHGLGFEYKGEQLLYEAAFMIGNSPERVSNNARTINGADEDFVPRKVASRIKGQEASSFLATSEFDDSGSYNPLNLDIKQTLWAFKDSPNDKFVIAEYDVFNKNSYTLENTFVGLFTDWDIDSEADDITKFDAINKIAYSTSKKVDKTFVGVKILNREGLPNYYPMGIPGNTDPLTDGEFTLKEKFQTLSGGLKKLGSDTSSPVKSDISFTTGIGPILLEPFKSKKVAFALIAGDNLSDLQQEALAAQEKYDQLRPDLKNDLALEINAIVPNPVTARSTVLFEIPEAGFVTAYICDMGGQKVKTLIEQILTSGSHEVSFDSGNLDSGTYCCVLRHSKGQISKKIIVIK